MEREREDGSAAQLRELGRILWGERVLVATVVLSAFGLAAFAMWLIARQRDQMAASQQQILGLFGQAPMEAPRMLPSAAGVMQSQYSAAPAPPMQTMMLTVSLATDRGTRVFQAPPHAGVRYWQVEVTNVGPAGSFAIISVDSSNNPINAVTIPANTPPRMFQMAPNQVLYARGNRANVEISISASAVGP